MTIKLRLVNRYAKLISTVVDFSKIMDFAVLNIVIGLVQEPYGS
jgi:hypothetical protein